MSFKNLKIGNWRQFRELDLEFHERLTIVTGANGSGKTTILNLLSRHFGWAGHLVGTPRRQRDGIRFYSDYWTEEFLESYEKWLEEKFSLVEEPFAPSPPVGNEQKIGTLTYRNDRTAQLSVPTTVGSQFT